jgi:opacity protein-like surface antigen
MRVSVPALAGLMLLSTFVPAAAGETGVYVSAHGGLSLPEVTNGTFPEPVVAIGRTTSEADDGYRLGGALGYIFNRYLRSEVELTYASHDLDTIDFFILPGVWTGPLSAEGKATALSGMFNTYLSLPTAGGWRPYVGGGLGYTEITADEIFAPALSPITTDGSDGAFSWQLMAGVGYEIAPNLELGGRYRFQHTGEVTVYNGVGEAQRLEETEAHSAEITLTWKLSRDDPAPLK